MDRQSLVFAADSVPGPHSVLPVEMRSVTHHYPSVDHDWTDDPLGIETYLQFLEKGRLQKRWLRLQVGLHTQKLSPSLSRTPELRVHRLLPSLPHLLVLRAHQVCLRRTRPHFD